MELHVIKNDDTTMTMAYRVARIVYAETLAKSLRVVEAMTSMIANATVNNKISIDDFISNTNIFESLNHESTRHAYLSVDAKTPAFQMCVRVAQRMLRGNLADSCNHATIFHREDIMPQWAMSRGYVADIDGILFYK